MVHELNAKERIDYLTSAILCASTPTVHARVPNTTKTYDRPVVQQCQKSSDKTPTPDVLSETYPNFRFRHKFSLMIVGPSMSGKSYLL